MCEGRTHVKTTRPGGYFDDVLLLAWVFDVASSEPEPCLTEDPDDLEAASAETWIVPLSGTPFGRRGRAPDEGSGEVPPQGGATACPLVRHGRGIAWGIRGAMAAGRCTLRLHNKAVGGSAASVRSKAKTRRR